MNEHPYSSIDLAFVPGKVVIPEGFDAVDATRNGTMRRQGLYHPSTVLAVGAGVAKLMIVV